jgi:HK97 family phage major capsid protein
MKIKITKEYQEIAEGTIIDADELTAKTILDAQAGVEYKKEVEEADEKALQEVITELTKEIVMSTEVKSEEKGIVEVIRSEPKYKTMKDLLIDAKKHRDVEFQLGEISAKAATGIGDRGGSSGGTNLVTPSFVSDMIYSQMMQEAIVFPRCTQFQLAENAGPTALIKQVNETVRSSTSTFGGLRIYKVDEGSAITPSMPVFTQKSLTIEKAAALVFMSDESIRDIVNIVDQTAGMVAKSFALQIDNDIVNGGLSIADPIVGHAATVAYTVAGAYPTAAEYFGMYNSMLPSYRTKDAIWIMATDTYAALQGLTTPITTSGSGYPLVNRNMKDPDKMQLLGHDVFVSEWATAASTSGNVMFINPTAYAVVTKEGMNSAVSLHVCFTSAQSAYRFYIRYNGAPTFASKLTLPNSKTVSPFVTRN